MGSLKSLWVCLLGFALVGGGGCEKRDEPARQTPLAYTLEESHLLQSYVDGLAEIAKTSPMADTLLTFYQTASTKARPHPGGDVQVLESPKTDKYFFVVPQVGVQTTPLPNQGAVAARYEGRVMELNNNNFSPFVRGLMVGHELVHARDEILDGEPPSEPLSPTWLTGEGHAHYVVYTILNEYTSGTWKLKAIESAHERRQLALANGHSEAAMTFNASSADSVRMVEMFGPLGLDDLSLLLTQFTVDANMLNLKEVTAGDMEKYQSLAGEFLYEFYSRYGAR